MKFLNLILVTIVIILQIILSYLLYENSSAIHSIKSEINKNKDEIEKIKQYNEQIKSNIELPSYNSRNSMPNLDEPPKIKLTQEEAAKIDNIISSELNASQKIRNTQNLTPSEILIKQLN